jgi:peptidoglycan hydrolase-like protein with peptidoglycan-binding domain
MTTSHTLLRRGSRGPEVTELQRSLNALPTSWRTPAMPMLEVDGAFGPLTAEAVRGFQTRARITADGIAGPVTRGKLQEALAASPTTPATPPAPVTAPATPAAQPVQGELPPEQRGSPHEPREIPPAEYHLIHFGTHGRWGVEAHRDDEPVRAGQQWTLGREDVRLIYEVLAQAVVYLQLEGPRRNAFFAQTRTGFRETVRYSGYIEAAKGARGMVLLAEHEAAILMGIASALGPTKWIFKGVNLLKVYVDNQRLVHATLELLSVALELRSVLRRRAPTLWRVLVESLLFRPTDLFNYEPDAVAMKPVRKSQLAGEIVGCILDQKPGRYVTFRTAIELLVTMTIAVVPSAAKGVRIETDADKLVEAMQARRHLVSKADARRIMEEVHTHEAEIRPALRKLGRAVQAVQR